MELRNLVTRIAWEKLLKFILLARNTFQLKSCNMDFYHSKNSKYQRIVSLKCCLDNIIVYFHLVDGRLSAKIATLSFKVLHTHQPA
jgi:hypothetical protein